MSRHVLSIPISEATREATSFFPSSRRSNNDDLHLESLLLFSTTSFPLFSKGTPTMTCYFLALTALSFASALVTPQIGFRSSSPAVRCQSTSFLQSTAVDIIEDEILNNPMFLEPVTKAKNDSMRPPDELIAIAKKFLVGSSGLGGDPNMLADNFQFEGPVVGPLSKDAFVKAIGQVDFKTAFPNWKAEFYGFHVDPLEEQANRVWYTARGRGVQEGPLLPFAAIGSGKEVVNPPQVCSLTIDHETGLITRYTIGYVVDRNVGNTGGLGGLYGILYALDRPLPFPEAQPWKKSWQYDLFQKIGALLG
jgi:hypothetical protein